MNDLETAFKAVYDAHIGEIRAKIDEAAAAIREAEKISEKYGIPFRARVSPLAQNYVPNSFDHNLVTDEEDNFLDNLDCYVSGYHSGWAHSAVCY
jgi:hypothetical protein